jgi:hypothetical protein
MLKIGKSKLVKTFRKELKDGYVLAEACLHLLGGNKSHYFCITGELKTENDGACYGRLDDDIAEHFPHLVKYQRWNLFSVNEGPMHYQANAEYWAGFTEWNNKGSQAPPNLEHLKSTIMYGAVNGDKYIDLEKLIAEAVQLAPFRKKPNLTGRIIHDGLMPLDQRQWLEYETKRQLFGQWLTDRFPHLNKCFEADMLELFGPDDLEIVTPES